MATTIDQKVVEMKFDNSDFERNTKQTMSTLEKLKAKLNFSGASKGLEDISASAKKVDMTGLAAGVETVRNKFSALEIMGVTALVNITNSAVNAGKALVKSISVDQISSGWNKMNEKLSYVQTLVNSTGLSVKEINGYLNELMWFSDETSYSFTDMTAALAQMTSTGGDIKKLVPMITGIANSVAFAGKGAGEFSRAIYNLNQSYGSGALTLMDWKSLQGAGVNSKQLTEELIAAGEALGTLQKGQVTIGTFNDSLKDRWATTEVMERAFSRFSTLSQAVRKAEEDGGYWIEEGGKKVWKDYQTASVAIDDLADQYDELGVKAFRAAQEAKTFKEAMDATADAVSSTWMRIFEDIFGDYNKQKKIWTDFANFLYDHIVEPLNVIEYKIKHALDFEEIDAMWDKLSGNAFSQSEALKDIEKRASKTSKTLEAYQKVVRKVWHGDYGNMQPRFDKLEKEGWDHRVVQTLVNKGVSYKLTLEDVQKAEKKYGITVENTDELLKEKQEMIDEINSSLSNLSEEQLKQLEMSEEEIELYNMLQKGADKYGMSLEDLISKMKKYNGRDLIFGKKKLNDKGKPVKDEDDNYVYERMGIVQNISSAILNIFQAIKDAWHEIFEGWTSVDLYMVLDKFNNFTAAIRKATENEKGLRNLKDTFKGLFSILKLITIITGGAFKIAFTIFKTVLQTLGVSVLDFTGAVGNLVSKFVDFITKNNIIIKGITKLTEIIAGVIKKVYQWIQSHIALNDILHKGEDLFNKLGKSFNSWFKKLKDAKKEGRLGEFLVESFIKAFEKIKEFASNAGTKILDWFSTAFAKAKGPFGRLLAGLKPAKEAGQLGKHIIDGLVEGFKTYAPKVLDGIKWVANVIIETFKGIFKIHSPSKIMMAMGGFILSGLLIGIKDSEGNVIGGIKTFGDNLLTVFKTIGTKIMDIIKNLDIGSVFVAAITAGFVVALVNISKAVTVFAKGLQNVNTVIAEFANVEKAFAGVLKGLKFKMIAGAVKDMAIAIAIIAASLLILSKADLLKVLAAAGILVVVLYALVGALLLLEKIAQTDPKSLITLSLLLLAVGLVIKNVAKAVKIVSKSDEMAVTTLIGFLGGIALFIGILMALSKYSPESVTKMSNMFLSIAVLLFIMTRMIKTLGKMDTTALIQGVAAMTWLAGLIVGLMAASNLIGKEENAVKMASTFAALALVFYILGRVVKTLGNMEFKVLAQGIGAVTALGIIIAGLMWATKLIGDSHNVEKIGATIAAVGGAMLMMALAVSILGRMKFSNFAQGIGGIAAFGVMIGLLIKTVGKYSTFAVSKAAATILALGGALLAMSIAAVIMGMISLPNLAKGVGAISILSGMLALMLHCAKQVSDSYKSIWAMVGAIGVMALVVGLLSLIDYKKLIAPTLAMVVLMGMFSVMMLSLKNLNIDKKALIGMGIMISVIAIMAGIVAILGKVNAKNAVGNTIALSLLLIAMVGALFILSKIGKINISGLLVSILGMASILIILSKAIDVLKKMEGVQNAGKSMLLLLGFLAGLSLVLLALTGIGLILTSGGIVGLIAGIAALFAMIGLIFLVIKAIDKINTIENAETNVKLMTHLMQSFIALLAPLAILGPAAAIGVTALYALTALLVPMLLFATAIGAITSYIPKLEEFMNKGMSVLIALAGGLGEMVGAFVGGMIAKLSASLPQVGLNLSMFMVNATPFIIGCKIVTDQTLKAVGILAACILALTAMNVIDGISRFISGGDFSRLGTELSEFGKNVQPFVESMKNIPSSLLNGIKSLSLGILALTAANVLDGIARFIGGGESSLSKFGEQLPPLGTSLAAFVTNLGTFSEQQVATVDCAGQAIKALAESAKALPKSGGWVQKILGEGSLADFADKMPGVAKGVKQFVSELGEFSDAQIKTAQCACEVIKAVADAADSVPKKDGLWQKIFGNDGLSQFADNMPKVAKGVNGFLTELTKGKITDAKNQTVIEAGTKVISSLAELGKDEAIESLNNNIVKFGEKLPKFATQLATFIKNMAAVSKEDTVLASENVNLIVEAIKNMLNIIKDTNTKETPNIKTSFEDVAKAGAEGLYTDDIKAKVQEKAKNTIDGFVSGLTSSDMLEKLKSAGVTDAKKVLEGYSSVKGANINSPSKAAKKLGVYTSEGLYVGIMSYSDRLYHAGESVANNAKDGLSKAVAKISSMINSDMDVNPTIRPVLDISDVADGVGQINSMFNGQSLGLTANLNAISSSMAKKNQNGTTNDVISAIKDLSNSLGGRTGDTYNINGITYDDSSSISNAVETLLRAANVERRI